MVQTKVIIFFDLKRLKIPQILEKKDLHMNLRMELYMMGNGVEIQEMVMEFKNGIIDIFKIKA